MSSMDVAEAVIWALKEVAGRSDTPDARDPALPAPSWSAFATVMALGTRVDNSMQLGDRAAPDADARHRDALLIASHVADIDRVLGLRASTAHGGAWASVPWADWLPHLAPGAVVEPVVFSRLGTPSASAILRQSAISGVAPSWRPEGLGFDPEVGTRELPFVHETEALDATGRRFVTRACPVRARDPGQILFARMGYVMWVHALRAIMAECADQLEAIRLTGPVVDEMPWQRRIVYEGP